MNQSQRCILYHVTDGSNEPSNFKILNVIVFYFAEDDNSNDEISRGKYFVFEAGQNKMEVDQSQRGFVGWK